MKKALIALSFAAAAFCSPAAYLMWQVGSDTVANDSYLNTHLEDGVQYYAQVKMGATGAARSTYTAVNRDDVATSWGLVGGAASLGDNRYQTVDLGTISDASSYSYYIEIAKYVNNSYEGVAQSALMTYAELSANNYVGTDLDIPNLATWQGTGYTVPEPTSALMVMVGLAFLGLKRRRV